MTHTARQGHPPKTRSKHGFPAMSWGGFRFVAFLLALVVLVVLGCGSGGAALGILVMEPKYQWQSVTPNAAFAKRDGAGALVHDGKMWLIGGWNPSDPTDFPKITNNEVWSSTAGMNWTLVKPNTYKDGAYNPATDWEGRHTAGYVVFKDKMWIVGGDANQGHYQNDVWRSADGVQWTKVNNAVPWGPRVLQYTLVFQNKIWVMGGQTVPQFAPAPEAFYRDIWNSSDGVTWQQVQANEPFWPQRGMIGGSVVFKGRMWVIGGGTYWTPGTPDDVQFNDVWSSADGVNWTRELEHAPWAARKYHDVTVFDGKMWVLAGHSGHGGVNLGDVWYSEDGVNWTQVPHTPWSARHASSVFVYNNALWLTGGLQNDVWKLTRTNPAPEPTAMTLFTLAGLPLVFHHRRGGDGRKQRLNPEGLAYGT